MIKVKNVSSCMAYLVAPDFNFHRKLMPGREIPISQEIYDELSCDVGFEKLVRGGTIKVTGANEAEVSVIETPFTVLSVDEIKKIYSERDVTKFAKAIANASPATKEAMVQLAVEMRITEPGFVALIKKYCQVDVVQAISIQVQATEG